VFKDGYEKPGECIAIDATSCSTVSLGGNRVVNMKLDFGSGKKWATFLKKKSDIPQDCMDFMELVKQAKGRPPMFIRLDNSAENKEFASICHTKYRTTVFEFTAKDTPQQNGRIEAAIAATWNQVRAMLDGVELFNYDKKKLWTEAFNTAVMVDGIIVRQDQTMSPDEKWSNELP
jgi:hypothetical protein